MGEQETIEVKENAATEKEKTLSAEDQEIIDRLAALEVPNDPI